MFSQRLVSRSPGETVYVVGAGANQCVWDPNGVSPPMISNVFKVAFRSGFLSPKPLGLSVRSALEFLQETTHLTPDQLRDHDLNFELVMDALLDGLSAAKDDESRAKLGSAFWGFHSILMGTLSSFEHYGVWSESLQRLGRIVVEEVAPILTFNYDTILEDAIESNAGVDWTEFESASGQAYVKAWQESLGGRRGSLLPFRDLAPHNWRREQAYGVRFEELEVTGVGVTRTVTAGDYYPVAPPNRVDVPFLKLHGSLNWLQYTDQPAFPERPGMPTPDTSKAGKVVLRREFLRVGDFPIRDWVYLVPFIITPNRLKKEAIRRPPFDELWRRAAAHLSRAKRLVVLGYSLSDEHTVDFLRSVDLSGIEELIIVNPSSRRSREIGNMLKPGLVPIHKASVEQYVWTHSLAQER